MRDKQFKCWTVPPKARLWSLYSNVINISETTFEIISQTILEKAVHTLWPQIIFKILKKMT